MRPLYKSHVLVALFLCFAAAASAQQTQGTAAVTAVPRLVRFAGSFHPALSQPAGQLGATFAIYSQQEGGTPLWTEDQNVDLDANGNYTVLLGSTKNEGVPVELFTAGESRWLQVKFYVPGEVDLPRVLLVSVPYALKAGDADTLGGKPASAYLLAASSASVQPEGPSGPAQPAQPNAAVSARTATGVKPALTSTGTTNYIPKFTDASGDVGNSAMYQYGTNIGIGTTTPGQLLTLQTGATGYTFLENLYGSVDPGNGATRLEVGNPVSSLMLTAYGSKAPGILGGSAGVVSLAGPLLVGNAAANAPLYLYAGNAYTAPQFTLTSTGNVGIGTQTPAALLDVAGNINLSGSIQNSGSTVLRVFEGINGPNIAIGPGVLANNTTGGQNIGIGTGVIATPSALGSNTTGLSNTAIGALALRSNTTGSDNIAVGVDALALNTNGSNNIAVGNYAAIYVSGSSSNNIHIGNQGTATDSGTIRIGCTTGCAAGAPQTTAFIAGIYGVTTSASNAVPVLIDSNGNLGTVSSSRRYKEDIQDMRDASNGLMRLRPVTFRYKKPFDDGSKPVQYGLIAEEVAEVYPDLVARAADGQIETVKYQVLDSMLLNELQKQNATIAAQKEEIRSLEERLARVEAALMSGTTVTASSR